MPSSDEGRPSPSPAVARRREAAIAGHTGDEAAARALLRDADPAVRGTALGALARQGNLVGADLEGATADPAAAVRRRAAEVAAHADPSLGVSAVLLRLLGDPDDTVVEVAAWACGERDGAGDGGAAVDALVRLGTGHAEALVREAAVAALGALGDERGLPAILAATRDRSTVRRRAVLALAPFEGPDVDAALDRASADRDWQVRQAAEDLR